MPNTAERIIRHCGRGRTMEEALQQDGILTAFQTPYYVDSVNGSDAATGFTWGTAKATLAAGLALPPTLRGAAVIYVAPGGHTGDHVTPLNAVAPFGKLIAVNPTPGQSFGAVYVTASAGAVLTIQARGWYVSGFEFDAIADQPCVVIGGPTAGNSGAGAIIEDCLFVGQNIGLTGIDAQSSIAGNPLVTIRNNGFYGFSSGATAGNCIMCSASGIDQPRFWVIENNWFADSDNLIDMNPRGFKESVIRYNTFYANGANQNPDEKIDNTGGNDTILYANSLGGTYTNAGGYVAGTNDEWGGNYNSLAGGLTAADPA